MLDLLICLIKDRHYAAAARKPLNAHLLQQLIHRKESKFVILAICQAENQDLMLFFIEYDDKMNLF